MSIFIISEFKLILLFLGGIKSYVILSLIFWLLSFECHLVLPCCKREIVFAMSLFLLILYLCDSAFLEQRLHCMFCLVLRNNPLVENSTRTKTHSKTTTTLPRCLPSPLIWNVKQSEIMFWCWTCFDGIAAERGSCFCFQHTHGETPSHTIMCGLLKNKSSSSGRREGRGLLLGGCFSVHMEDCRIVASCGSFPSKTYNLSPVTCHCCILL